MTRDEIVQLFKDRQQFWRYREADRLASAYAKEAVVISPIFGEVKGLEQIEESYRLMFRVFHGWSFDSDNLLVDDDRAAQIFQLHGMHSQEFFGIAPSWKTFTVTGVLFFEFQDGEIVHERRVYDFTDMLTQLGVLKPE